MPSPQTEGMRPKESRPTGVSTSAQACFTLMMGRSVMTAPVMAEGVAAGRAPMTSRTLSTS